MRLCQESLSATIRESRSDYKASRLSKCAASQVVVVLLAEIVDGRGVEPSLAGEETRDARNG
jgi:hypothetical protein